LLSTPRRAVIYPKKGSFFRLAEHIWWIAGFGILHGINEWLDMFIELEGPLPAHVLKLIRIVTLVGSFLFLLRFGTKVIAESKKKYRVLEVLPLVLFVGWAVIVVASRQRLLKADIFARYFLCAPGAFLTALGLFLQIPQFKQTKVNAAIRNLRIAAIAFMFYTLFAGIIVKKAAFLPASILNYDAFRAAFGAPVQIFRALCAVVLAYSTANLLSIFRWETQEALRRSEQRCSTIASAAPIILFVQDRDSVITFIQGKGLGLLGLEPQELIGRRINDVFPSVPQLCEDSRRALSGDEFVATVTIGDLVFECCYSPLLDPEGEVTGIIGVALDVTLNVKAQEEVDKYRRQIERDARLVEIGSMSSAMAQQLDEPLAVTRLLLQRITSDLDAAHAPEAVNSGLEKSLSEVSKVVDIVDRFRSLAQVSGKAIFAPVDIYQIAKRVITVFAQNATRANLTMAVKDIHLVPLVSISSRELEQVFFILVQNAIDAADSAKKQRLTISCRMRDKEIELLFSDTCGGIQPDKLQHIFEPFFSAERDASRTGLSLAIAKQLVCNHGGAIVAESRPGQGTTFRVTLPVKKVY
jgi:PAS domain S-box-containing protein